MSIYQKVISFALMLALGPVVAAAQEQHFDVEFGYEDGGIEFESNGLGFDANGIFETEFEVTNMDGSQVAEDPGFASNFTKGDEAFSVTSGDSIFVNVNQSQTFGTYLTYFNADTNSFESTDALFNIQDNSPAGTTDLIISESGLSGDLSQFVVTSNGFEIDTHVDFVLSSGAAEGAYGLLLNIESDNLSGDLTNTTSDRFWVLFNNGLSEESFESAVDNFSAVPEPSAVGILALAFAGVLRRNRK